MLNGHPSVSGLQALVDQYEHIESGFRSIQKDLEAMPKILVVHDMIHQNLESIESQRNVAYAREAVRAAKREPAAKGGTLAKSPLPQGGLFPRD